MKFNCPPATKKPDSRLAWHDWFAWFPVRVADNDCRWLEKVSRRGNMEYYGDGGSYWKFEYKAKE
jgi:hypothetical protein